MFAYNFRGQLQVESIEFLDSKIFFLHIFDWSLFNRIFIGVNRINRRQAREVHNSIAVTVC